jgi:hypothetical protein
MRPMTTSDYIARPPAGGRTSGPAAPGNIKDPAIAGATAGTIRAATPPSVQGDSVPRPPPVDHAQV